MTFILYWKSEYVRFIADFPSSKVEKCFFFLWEPFFMGAQNLCKSLEYMQIVLCFSCILFLINSY